MERHDPLSAFAPCEELPAQHSEPKKHRSRKLPPLLREVAGVKDDTLAFLYGGPEQQPADYQRNFERAAVIREDFVRFCTVNTHFANWRQAWAAFVEQQPKEVEFTAEVRREPIPFESQIPPLVTLVKTPAMPRWKQRLYQAAQA
jgi:hypothetical protein